eukprot:4140859-Amphidinium_carterae.1
MKMILAALTLVVASNTALAVLYPCQCYGWEPAFERLTPQWLHKSDSRRYTRSVVQCYVEGQGMVLVQLLWILVENPAGTKHMR